MTHRLLPLLAVSFSGLLALAPQGRAETDFGQVASYVARMLENSHYSHTQFDNAMSSKLLENYLNLLDPRHIFFTQEQVDKFRADYGTTLDDRVTLRDLSPAMEIYKLYTARVKDRVDFVKRSIKEQKFTFDSSRTVNLKREKLPWPKDAAASDVLWRDLLESEMLQERLLDKAKVVSDAKKAEKAKNKAKKGETVLKAEALEPNSEGKNSVAKVEPKPAAGGAKKEETPQERIAKDYDRLLKGVEDNNEEEVVDFFLSSLAEAYDPHTEYMSVSEMESFNIQMTHSLFGIGALLGVKDEVAEIQGIVVGGPADKQGVLKLNDKIISVAQGDGEFVPTKGLALNKIVEKIRGDKGTTVRMKVIPASDPGALNEIAIIRDEVPLKDKLANAELIQTPPELGKPMKLGWITLPSFYADMEKGSVSCTKDVEKLLLRLMKEGMEGLVFDLRSDGGGSLEEAIKLTGLFVPSGPVVQIKDWRGEISARDCPNPRAVYDGPMVVLTDKASASASEIFAAALQDYRRAVIVGDKSTYGKGTVQTIQPVERVMPFFSDKTRAGNVKVTIQKFYRIAGGSTQLQGVIPDLHLPSLRDVMDFGEASTDNPLPYDQIPALPYSYSRPTPLPMDALKAKMESRVKQSKDFSYIEDEAKRLKERMDRNVASLNEEVRWKEREDNEKRRTAYTDDRDKRAAEITEKVKDGGVKIFHLTLDNVSKPELVPESAFTKEQSSGMRMVKNDDEDAASGTEGFPFGLEPTKLEAIHIMRDLIDLTTDRGATAKAEAERK